MFLSLFRTYSYDPATDFAGRLRLSESAPPGNGRFIHDHAHPRKDLHAFPFGVFAEVCEDIHRSGSSSSCRDPHHCRRVVMAEIFISPIFGHDAGYDQVSSSGEF